MPGNNQLLNRAADWVVVRRYVAGFGWLTPGFKPRPLFELGAFAFRCFCI